MRSRRTFIKQASIALGAFSISKAWAGSPNGDIRVAVVGLRGRGRQLIEWANGSAGCKLVAVCDADAALLETRAAETEEKYGIKVDRVNDYRAVLDRSDIDAVVLTTPNHLHAQQTIWACQAGKDVYVEKPVCYSIWEGRRMVEAAEKYGRVVQPGFQNRSDIGLGEAFPWIKEGNIGEITMVRGLCYRNRESIGILDKPLTPPASVDYSAWLGPRPDEPMFRPRFHYDWHWNFNTGNGDVGNQGPHEMDLVRWILGDPDHAKGVYSFGGRFGWDDAGNTPNMHIVSFDWGTIPVYFEVRDLWINPETNAAANFKGNRVGVIVTCEHGEFRGGRGGGIVYDKDGKRMQRFKGDGGHNHFPAFLKAMRSRKQKDLAVTLEDGYKSSVLSHMANISYRIGDEVSDSKMKRIAEKDERLFEAYSRYRDHLGAWDIDFRKEKWTNGVPLEFDPKSERFVSGRRLRKANQLVQPEQRKGHEIPAKV